jgi:hypothetical protein
LSGTSHIVGGVSVVGISFIVILKLSLQLVPSLSVAVKLRLYSPFSVGVPVNFQVFESNAIHLGNVQFKLYQVIGSLFVSST